MILTAEPFSMIAMPEAPTVINQVFDFTVKIGRKYKVLFYKHHTVETPSQNSDKLLIIENEFTTILLTEPKQGLNQYTHIAKSTDLIIQYIANNVLQVDTLVTIYCLLIDETRK